MEKTKIFNLKILFFGILSLVFLGSVVVFMSACNENSGGNKTLENTYTASFYDYDSYDSLIKTDCEIKYYTDGSYVINVLELEKDGYVYKRVIEGTAKFDSNGNLEKGNLLKAKFSNEKLGHVVVSETMDLSNYEIALYNKLLEAGFFDIKKLDGAIFLKNFELVNGPIVLQTSANNYAKGDILSFTTQTEMILQQDYGIDPEEIIYGFENSRPNFVSDYVVLKGEFNLSTQAGLEAFFEANPGFALYGDVVEENGCEVDVYHNLEITAITGLDTNTAGLQTATLTYATPKGTTKTKQVSVYVYSTEEEMPEQQAKFVEYESDFDFDYGIAYVEKGKEFYAYGELEYRTFADNTNEHISLNKGTVDAPVLNDGIVIAGFDKNTIGWQTVTISFKGKTLKVETYVFDAEHNPAIRVTVRNGSRLQVVEGIDAQTGEKVYYFNDVAVILDIICANGAVLQYTNPQTASAEKKITFLTNSAESYFPDDANTQANIAFEDLIIAYYTEIVDGQTFSYCFKVPLEIVSLSN